MIQQTLLDWYAREGRDLPWRHVRDPYAILVSELMLQQTQVDRVIPKWEAWLEEFPTVEALAEARAQRRRQMNCRPEQPFDQVGAVRFGLVDQVGGEHGPIGVARDQGRHGPRLAVVLYRQRPQEHVLHPGGQVLRTAAVPHLPQIPLVIAA